MIAQHCEYNATWPLKMVEMEDFILHFTPIKKEIEVVVIVV